MAKHVTMSTIDALNRAAQLHGVGRFKEAEYLCQAIINAQPNNLGALNFLGGMKLQFGQYEDAKTALEAAEKINPNSPEVLHNLGVANQKLGELADAISLFERAIELAPETPRSLIALATVLNGMGEHEAALSHSQAAIKIDSSSVLALNAAAVAYIARKEFDPAELHLRKTLDRDPHNVTAQYNMTEVTLQRGDYEEALEWAEQAEALSPNDTEILYNKSLALDQLDRSHEALEILNRVIEINPQHRKAVSERANVLSHIGDHELAIAAYSELIQHQPENAELLVGRGNSYIQCNEKEAARADFDGALTIDAEHIGALSGLGRMKKYRLDDPNISIVQRLSRDSSKPPLKRIAIGFEMAKISEDVGNAEELFLHLKNANELKREFSKYDFSKDETKFAAVRRQFERIRNSNNASNEPSRALRHIFVLGMPRSGTTLTEQILSSHTDVYGAGELPNLNRAFAPFISPKHNRDKDLNPSDLETISTKYTEYAGNLIEGQSVITDKMPHNFMLVGFILKMLPTAKIVHLNRDPRAVCWSLFKRSFGNFGHGYSHRLEDLAKYYARYLKLMEYWRTNFPKQIYDLNYQALTENQEAETRKLLEYCDLEWQDECLNFHQNSRAVKTASLLQVRQKMYKGSSDAWRPYEPLLGELLTGFDQYGVPFPD